MFESNIFSGLLPGETFQPAYFDKLLNDSRNEIYSFLFFLLNIENYQS